MLLTGIASMLAIMLSGGVNFSPECSTLIVVLKIMYAVLQLQDPALKSAHVGLNCDLILTRNGLFASKLSLRSCPAF